MDKTLQEWFCEICLFAFCRQEKSDSRCYSGVCEANVKLQSAASCPSFFKRLETET